MGQQRKYLKTGGFSEYLYHQVGQTIISPNGVEAKVIEKIMGNAYDGLPMYSNTSDVYLKTDRSGNVVQARIYKNRMPVCDFDWDHEHKNTNGDVFPRGVVHVQQWKSDSKGLYHRDNGHARYMSPQEIERFGCLINLVSPDTRLR